jgi:ribonuclease Z
MLSVTFLGTAASIPTIDRNVAALAVQREGEMFLFDCGEGTQRQLVRSVGLADLDDVFITHFHADHWLGLPGLLKTFDLRDRERPLTVHGPRGLRELMATLRIVYGRVRYELRIVELNPGDVVERDGYRVAPFSVRHRTPAVGYALFEDQRPGEFHPERAAALGVAAGPDFGRLQRGEIVDGVTPDQVMGPPRPGRKLVLSGDTAPSPAVAVAAHEADVLVHEATFAQDEAERAAQTGHSTAAQAAEVARDAGVRLLALVHLSTRYAGPELREEARAIFPRTEVPRDFDAIDVPLPERGEPELVRWSGSGEREPAPA